MIALALAAGLVLDGAARAEVRAGTSVNGQDPDAATVSGDLGGHTDDGELRFGISPTGTVGQTTEALVRGFIQGELKLDQLVIRAVQRGEYGKVDMNGLTATAPAAPGAPPVVPSAPAARSAVVQESISILELELHTDRRTTMAVSGGWTVSGGANAESRAALPLGRGPLFRARFDWLASRTDRIRADLAGFETTFSNGRSAAAATAALGWQAQPWRSVRLLFAAGPGIGSTAEPGAAAIVSPYPVATASANARLSPDLLVDCGAGVQPQGDPASGILVERGSVWLAADWHALPSLSFGGRVTGSLTLTSGGTAADAPRAGDHYFQGELSAAIPVGRTAAVIAGGRAALANRPLEGQPGQQWAAFVAFRITFTAMP